MGSINVYKQNALFTVVFTFLQGVLRQICLYIQWFEGRFVYISKGGRFVHISKGGRFVHISKGGRFVYISKGFEGRFVYISKGVECRFVYISKGFICQKADLSIDLPLNTFTTCRKQCINFNLHKIYLILFTQKSYNLPISQNYMSIKNPLFIFQMFT